MRRISHPSMRVFSIVVSISDAALRNDVLSTLDRHAFVREALELDVDSMPGFLPMGVLGAQVGFAPPKAVINARAAREKPVVIFHNHMNFMHGAIAAFFDQRADELPYRMVVEDHSLEEVLAAAARGEPVLYLLGFNTFTSQAAQHGEPSMFFEPFWRNHLCVSAPADLEARTRRATVLRRRDEKRRQYEAVHRSLLASGCVIPLGQRLPVAYYPDHIAGIEFADTSLGIPYVDKIRKKR